MIKSSRQQMRQAVYAAMRRSILLNELKPGEVLTELGLADLHGCSQGTVREALLRLEADGLVTRSGHRGTHVTELDPEAADELVALRRRIEARGAQRAAARIGAADLADLARRQALMDEAAAGNDAYALLEQDIDFHLALFRLAGLPALEPILLRCMLHTHRQNVWAPRHQRPLAQTASRHRPIFVAAKQHDGAALARALEHHIDTIVAVTPAAQAS
jgi:DNA-binding GntR family transcriptional regulator